MTTLVIVGNAKQPFPRLLRAVIQIVGSLPKPVIVQHGNTPFESPLCQRLTFLDRDAFSSLIMGSRLVISHAGAGCVIEALRAGRIPVVMPRRRKFLEHIDDHQYEFARMLNEAQKAIVVEEPGHLEDGVRKALLLGELSEVARKEPPLVGLVRDVLQRAALSAD